jgi:hypothetical protein
MLRVGHKVIGDFADGVGGSGGSAGDGDGAGGALKAGHVGRWNGELYCDFQKVKFVSTCATARGVSETHETSESERETDLVRERFSFPWRCPRTTVKVCSVVYRCYWILCGSR